MRPEKGIKSMRKICTFNYNILCWFNLVSEYCPQITSTTVPEKYAMASVNDTTVLNYHSDAERPYVCQKDGGM